MLKWTTRILEDQLKPDLEIFKETSSRTSRSLSVQPAERWSQTISLNRADMLSALPTPLEALTNLFYCQEFCGEKKGLVKFLTSLIIQPTKHKIKSRRWPLTLREVWLYFTKTRKKPVDIYTWIVAISGTNSNIYM